MPILSPDPIIDSIVAYRRSKVLMIAAYFKVFDILESSINAADAAKELGLHPRSTEILMDSLVAVGYVKKNANHYRNAPLASRFLVSGRQGYLGDNLKYQEIISEAWQDLRSCMKSGSTSKPLDYWLKDHEEFTAEYIRGMANIALKPALEIASLVKTPNNASMLDIGAGPGSYTLALLRKNPSMTATLFDLPSTLEVTRELIAKQKDVRSRIRFQVGDYLKDDFGEKSHDLILLSHITHDESPKSNRAMLKKAVRALKPGGKAIIHDFTVDPSRTTPTFGALFSVHMLAYTSGGRTYTLKEYHAWMRDAGLSKIYTRKIGAHSKNGTRIIVGTKVP
ncbi:MAG: hypothetical protein COB53_03005 [Elusimicrobia bacterium]|nr:MAG: hypothetical protein COB53_03005 [Elusimicrobiota bacterium]